MGSIIFSSIAILIFLFGFVYEVVNLYIFINRHGETKRSSYVIGIPLFIYFAGFCIVGAMDLKVLMNIGIVLALIHIASSVFYAWVSLRE